MIVIDASVAAKWLLSEAGSEAAIALQESPDVLFAPDLIRLEVASAITRRVRSNNTPLPPLEAVRRCDRWFHLLDRTVISLVPQQELLNEAVQLSADIRHSLHDCLYLALAQRLNAPLVTSDSTFYERAAPAYPSLRLLGR